MPIPLGVKIRELRKQKGFTLERLAELADSSKSYIWELENKDPPRPSGEKIARIAEALGVTADYLLDDQAQAVKPDVVDQAFFRQYRRLNKETKERIRDLVELWGKKE